MFLRKILLFDGIVGVTAIRFLNPSPTESKRNLAATEAEEASDTTFLSSGRLLPGLGTATAASTAMTA